MLNYSVAELRVKWIFISLIALGALFAIYAASIA